MRYAIIRAGRVINVVVAESPLEPEWIEAPAGVGPGDQYDIETGEFSPSLPPVPAAVSRFQARAALHKAGLLSRVEALMADPQTDPIAVLAWTDAIEFRRSSPTIATLARALGLDDERVDALFRAAAQIEA